MKEITLTKGQVALVDDEDYEFLSQWKWHAKPDRDTFYAARNAQDLTKRSGRATLRMHQAIMDAPSSMEVDHRNGDGLDNRKSNLRIATHGANQQNRSSTSANRSGFKGVSWFPPQARWRATIQADGVWRLLGYFTDPIDAARAYNDAALDLHGEFAVLNEV